MFKLRLSFLLSLITSSLTLLIGIINDGRLSTILYRTTVSMVLFAVFGYVLGEIIERFFQHQLRDDITKKGNIVDILSDNTYDETGKTTKHTAESPQFQPLTPDNFENIKKNSTVT